MNNITIIEKLKSNPWFDRLNEDHFNKIVSIASEVRWPAGEVIFQEGDVDHCIYLLLKGRVALDINFPTRGRIRILTVNENEIFGWSAFLPVVRIRTAGAHTILDSEAIAFDAAVLRVLCEQDHELGYHVYERLTDVIAGRLSATRLQLLDIYAAGKEGDSS